MTTPRRKRSSASEPTTKNNRRSPKVKPISFAKNIRITKLSNNLEAELTAKDRVFQPFWRSCTQQLSNKIWLPRTVDANENPSNNYSLNSVPNSRHFQRPTTEQNSPAAVWKSLQFSIQDITTEDYIKVMRKIKIYPTKAQKELFEKCLGTHRYFYNKAIDCNRQNEKISSFISLREKVMPKYKEMQPDNPEYWVKEIPYDTCQLAIKDFASNLKTCKTNLRKGHIKPFEFKYMTKKEAGIFWIDHRMIKHKAGGNLHIFPSRLGAESRLKLSKKGREVVKRIKTRISDTAIQKDKTGFYILLYIEVPNKHKKKPVNNDIIALDPGVRTFLTGYSNKEVIEYGIDLTRRLRPKFDRVDKLKVVCNTPDVRKKLAKKLKKRCDLLRVKARNIVSDFQWKAAKHLTDNYSCILLPEFNTSSMVKRDAGLPKPVRKAMLALSHYKFKQKIEWYAKNKSTCKVIYCGEEFTSKTCTKCGLINENLGASKVFICQCGNNIDRDWNGARNIYIKNIAPYFDKKLGPDPPIKVLEN